MIDMHENASCEALGVMELTGALAWLGLWQRQRLSRFPQRTLAATLMAAVVTFGLMGWAASIGGDIRHPEIRTGPTAPAAENAPAKPPLARVIGDGMVNLKWGWPASETVHFIGLCSYSAWCCW